MAVKAGLLVPDGSGVSDAPEVFSASGVAVLRGVITTSVPVCVGAVMVMRNEGKVKYPSLVSPSPCVGLSMVVLFGSAMRR